VFRHPRKKFDDHKSAEDAIKAMDGKEMSGERMIVEFAGNFPKI